MLSSLARGAAISKRDPAVLGKVSETNRCRDNSKNQGGHSLLDLLAHTYAKALWGMVV